MDRQIPITFKETIHRRGRDIDGFCHKSPIFSSGSLIGIAGIFIDAPKAPLIKINIRERQCLINLVKGMSAKQSAASLGLSHRTVEGYLEDLRQKTGSHNQAQLIAFYHEHGA